MRIVHQTCAAIAGVVLLTGTPSIVLAQSTDDEIARLKAEIERLRARTKKSDSVVVRGNPQRITTRVISVFIPENASNVQVRAFMKNEPWGGAQNPPKPNTDDLGSTNFQRCPTGNGECPIGWSRVSNISYTSLPNGRTRVSATFSNWAHRNDRTGRLEVKYQLD